MSTDTCNQPTEACDVPAFFRPVSLGQIVRYKHDPSGVSDDEWGMMIVTRETRGGFINGIEINVTGQRGRVLSDLCHVDDPYLLSPANREMISGDYDRGVWDYLPGDLMHRVNALEERLAVMAAKLDQVQLVPEQAPVVPTSKRVVTPPPGSPKA